MATPQDDGSQWWVPLIQFACHITVGTGIFLVIAIPAVLLDWLVQWVHNFNASKFIVYGLIIAKMALFGVDLALFLIYLMNASWQFLGSMRWRK